MGTLYETLNTDLKNAMKAKNVATRDILRLIISTIKNVKIDKMTDLSDDDMIKIMQKEIKQIQETMASLTDPSRAAELADEQKKIDILSAYLPQMLDADELKIIVQELMTEKGIEHPTQNRGAIIRPIKEKYGATVDGRLLNEVIMGM